MSNKVKDIDMKITAHTTFSIMLSIYKILIRVMLK